MTPELTAADIDQMPPGSEPAREHGCKCDKDRNAEGAGLYADLPRFDFTPLFDVDENCPLHSRRAKAARLGIKLPKIEAPAATEAAPEPAEKSGLHFRFPGRA